ncbi:MAG: endonuclease V [Nitrospirae bacterium]|nr:endonuclease V [Nitrospirota bacterium]
MKDIKLSANLKEGFLKEARQRQMELAIRVEVVALSIVPRLVAGVDAAFLGDKIIGSACLHRYEGLDRLEAASVVQDVEFPYVPGFLSFRESPVMLNALKALSTLPDLIIVDGQGIAHPRRIGLASHIGVLLGIPTIGCAKSLLIGTHDNPGPLKGDWQYLYDRGQVIGAALRSRKNVKPLYISPGHLINIADSISVILHTTTRYRLPEPIRCAHNLSAEEKGRRRREGSALPQTPPTRGGVRHPGHKEVPLTS